MRTDLPSWAAICVIAGFRQCVAYVSLAFTRYKRHRESFFKINSRYLEFPSTSFRLVQRTTMYIPRAASTLASALIIPLYIFPGDAPDCTPWAPVVQACVSRCCHTLLTDRDKFVEYRGSLIFLSGLSSIQPVGPAPRAASQVLATRAASRSSRLRIP